MGVLMKFTVLSIAFLFGSYPLAAQTTAPAQFLTHVNSSCPVSMRLNQVVSIGSHLVGNGYGGTGFETSLHLILLRAPLAKIVTRGVKSAEVTVHGYKDMPSFNRVSPGNAPIAQQLQVEFTAAGDGEVSSDFVVDGLASVGWLEIDSVTLADGSAWEPALGEMCTVSPSMVIPVGQPATIVR